MFPNTRQLPFLLIFILFSIRLWAQENQNPSAKRLKIKSITLGSKMIEQSAFGNNTMVLAPLLKYPEPYTKYISNQSYNSFIGNPIIQWVYSYHLGLELYKHNSDSRFWRKNTVQSSLFFTNKLHKGNMAMGNQGMLPDTTFYDYNHHLEQKLQFIGAQLGLNRRLKISRKINFVTGIQLLGSLAIHHKYKQYLDSSTFHAKRGRTSRITTLASLEGRNYTQWQAIIPLALEIDLYRKQIFLRPEFNAGIISGKLRSFYRKTPEEAHGFGITLIYQVMQRSKVKIKNAAAGRSL